MEKQSNQKQVDVDVYLSKLKRRRVAYYFFLALGWLGLLMGLLSLTAKFLIERPIDLAVAAEGAGKAAGQMGGQLGSVGLLTMLDKIPTPFRILILILGIFLICFSKEIFFGKQKDPK